MLQIGSLVDGKYKILNKIGQGGMSVVYLAMNEKANKQWAVKEVRKDGVKDFEIVRQGLVAEIDILKKLNHPHLPSIVDVIDTEDSFIIIMDYIQGNSLNVALDEYGAQQQDDVIAWAKQLCDVLGYLHTRTPAIIYRDMKPANVMLKPDGTVTLIDFGTAREFKEKNLADTTCLGTVGYAAPEQFGGMGQTDARTDIYCLGATLYHLVTGMNPCEPPYAIRPIREINPSLSSGLEKIILKCTQRDPNQRYQSAAELMYALEHYEEIDGRFRKKQKGKLLKFVACAALTLACAGTSAWGYVSAEKVKHDNYDFILANAATYEDYFNAILTDPTRTEAYLGTGDKDGLIGFLISDYKLDEKETGVLRTLSVGLDEADGETVDVMSSLKKSDYSGYQEVCYQIGNAYLFYSTSAATGDTYIDDKRINAYSAAAIWFEKCVDKYPFVEFYCNISGCLSNVSALNATHQAGMLAAEYETFYDSITKLHAGVASFGDDMKLHVWSEITRILSDSTTAQSFCLIDKKADMLSLLETIKTDILQIDNKFLENTIKETTELIDVTIGRIASIKEG